MRSEMGVDHNDTFDQLRAELSAVEPSPAFAAGVRARVATGRAPRTVLQLSFAALSIVAVWALLAAGVPRPGVRTTPSQSVIQETASSALSVTLPPPAAGRHASPPILAAPRRAAAAKPVTGAESRFDVLVPPDQAIAVQRLLQWHAAGRQLRLARDGHAVSWLTGALIPQRPVEIPLVTIEPLPGAESGVGGKSR